jgi:hypothetical protein
VGLVFALHYSNYPFQPFYGQPGNDYRVLLKVPDDTGLLPDTPGIESDAYKAAGLGLG